jgi:cellulose synthase/poly-beta-1,6-N-acetylglucosamine synthase-like glycosyltransferase
MSRIYFMSKARLLRICGISYVTRAQIYQKTQKPAKEWPNKADLRRYSSRYYWKPAWARTMWLEMLFTIVLLLILILGYTILFLGIFLMGISFLNPVRYRFYKLDDKCRPTFSLVAPCHNEEKVIERTTMKFLETTYPEDKKELIILNDGSTDRTEEIARRFAYKIIEADTGQISYSSSKKVFKNITLLNRRGGTLRGKSRAVNDAIKYAQSELMFFMDADIQVAPDVFERAARHFADPKVGAVAGYVGVEPTKKLLTQFLDFEYVIGQQFLRRGFNVVGLHYIIPGGAAVIRRSVLNTIGGYQHDTLAEDTDLTWRIMTDAKKQIHFDASVKVIADEPTALMSLWNQRLRWARGNLEVTWKHRDKVGKARYGRTTTYGYPFWIASLILPFAFILSNSATLLAYMWHVNFGVINALGIFVGVAFIVTVVAGTLINKGKSFWGGFLTPGLPVLISILFLLISGGGIGGYLINSGHLLVGEVVEVILSAWALIAIPGTFLCLKLLNNKKYEKLGTIIQIGIFGYWMFLITNMFDAYIQELQKKERKWIRTER